MVGFLLCGLAFGHGQQFVAPQAKAELVSEYAQIKPGSHFRVALHLAMAPGWHSYYSNPGECGQATNIRWNLPEGFHAGPIQWPLPHRLVVSGVAGYVYERDAWLVTEIQAPEHLASGSTVVLSGTATWLLCREACVPQKATVHLTLPVADANEPSRAFAPAEENLPGSKRINGISARLVPAENAVELQIPGSKDAEFFPADAAYFGADLAKVGLTASTERLLIPISKYAATKPSRITGILHVRSGSSQGLFWIDLKVRNL